MLPKRDFKRLEGMRLLQSVTRTNQYIKATGVREVQFIQVATLAVTWRTE